MQGRVKHSYIAGKRGESEFVWEKNRGKGGLERENGASGILTRVGEMRTSTISDCHDERQLFRPALSSPRQVRACMRRGRSDRGAVACSGEPAGMQNKPWKGQADTTLRLLG